MRIIFILFLSLTFFSCSKSISTDEVNYEETSGVFAHPTGTLSERPLTTQRARVTMWLMFDSSNYTSERADMLEENISDTFSNAVTVADSVKLPDGSDNIAIKNSSSLLVKEFRKYPQMEGEGWDEIPLKTWDYSQDTYYLKVLCNNFPESMYSAFLFDKCYNRFTRFPSKNNTTWIKITVATAAEADPHRFSIMIRKWY